MKKSLEHFSFMLSNTDVLPSDISILTGITPNTALKRGESNPTKDLPRQNIWIINSDIRSEVVADHWKNVKNKIIHQQTLLRDIGKTGMVVVNIGIKGGSKAPLIPITPDMSTFSGYVGAIIEIDHIQGGDDLPTELVCIELSLIKSEVLGAFKFTDEVDSIFIDENQNKWSVKSTAHSDDVEYHWDEIKDKIIPKQTKIRELAQIGLIKLKIVSIGKKRLPPIQIPASMSAFAGYIDTIIEIDHLQRDLCTRISNQFKKKI